MSLTEQKELVRKIVQKAQDFANHPCNHEDGRFQSWNYCHNAFRNYIEQRKQSQAADYQDDVAIDYLCLQLGYYLASWGMLRGSFLLYKNYKVHQGLVEKIVSPEYDCLWELDCKQLVANRNHEQTKLQELIDFINDYYFAERKEVKEVKSVKISITLVSKILLGTIACMPAYDSYIISTLRKNKKLLGGISVASKPSTLTSSLVKLAEFYVQHEKEFKKHVAKAGLTEYPDMKLLDMGLWNMEFDEIQQAKAAQKAAATEEVA